MVCLKLAGFDSEYEAAMIATEDGRRFPALVIQVSPRGVTSHRRSLQPQEEPTWLSVNEVANLREYSFTELHG